MKELDDFFVLQQHCIRWIQQVVDEAYNCDVKDTPYIIAFLWSIKIKCE